MDDTSIFFRENLSLSECHELGVPKVRTQRRHPLQWPAKHPGLCQTTTYLSFLTILLNGPISQNVFNHVFLSHPSQWPFLVCTEMPQPHLILTTHPPKQAKGIEVNLFSLHFQIPAHGFLTLGLPQSLIHPVFLAQALGLSPWSRCQGWLRAWVLQERAEQVRSHE